VQAVQALVKVPVKAAARAVAMAATVRDVQALTDVTRDSWATVLIAPRVKLSVRLTVELSVRRPHARSCTRWPGPEEVDYDVQRLCLQPFSFIP